MIKVSLRGAEFFAYHGFYPEEQLLGNRFIVDIDAEFNPSADISQDEIANTVNYEQLYAVAAHEMQHTRKLLETVAQGIAHKIRSQHPFIETITVELKKLNPPLKGVVAYSSITVIDRKKV